MSPLLSIAALLFALADREGRALVPSEVEFPFDDATLLRDGEQNAGKLWRSPTLAHDGSAVPLVIFVHGITYDGKRHHWLTVDESGPWDARPFLTDLVRSQRVVPHLAAAISQTRDAEDPSKLFAMIDFDRFVDAIEQAALPWQHVDRKRIVVVGHSASVCTPNTGAFTALQSHAFHPLALLAVDGCLAPVAAPYLVSTPGAEHVVVTYQRELWARDFDTFEETWQRALQGSAARGLRVLERLAGDSLNAHLEIVERTVRRWLPIVLSPEGDRATQRTALQLRSHPSGTPATASPSATPPPAPEEPTTSL